MRFLVLVILLGTVLAYGGRKVYHTSYDANITCHYATGNFNWCFFFKIVEFDDIFDDTIFDTPVFCSKNLTYFRRIHTTLPITDDGIFDKQLEPGFVIHHNCTNNSKTVHFTTSVPEFEAGKEFIHVGVTLDVTDTGTESNFWKLLFYWPTRKYCFLRSWQYCFFDPI